MSEAQPSKPLIGLTGGIASGKSTVGKQLAKLGIVVIDADGLAREVVAKGSEGLRDVVAAFGNEVLAADGGIDREKLGAIVFRDPDARKRLNAIIHPRIAQLSLERIAQAQHGSAPYVVYEAPLLVETGSYKAMAALIVVAAPPELQIKRVVTRDGLNEDAAKARLAAQLPVDAKVAVADYVIHNNDDRSALIAQTQQVHREILRRFDLATDDGTDPASQP
ncbi:MAG TPA: dephospho-CoA kinase [Polyangiales bacterium]|nr:dephospho-CoA kinase [Polyangiales bacterium]